MKIYFYDKKSHARWWYHSFVSFDVRDSNNFNGVNIIVIDPDEFHSSLDKYIKNPKLLDNLKECEVKIIFYFTDTFCFGIEELKYVESIYEKYKLPRNSINFITDSIQNDNKDYEKFEVLELPRFPTGDCLNYQHLDLSKRLFDNIVTRDDGSSNRGDYFDMLREKYFTSFNRTPKPHRTILFNFLSKYNLLDKGNVSYLWSISTTNSDAQKNEMDNIGEKIGEHFRDFPEGLDGDAVSRPHSDIEINELKKILPYLFDTHCDNYLQKGNPGKMSLIPYFNSYFNICSMTKYTEENVTFDDKISKPMISFLPFIVVGDKNTLGVLHDWGFKTFHPYIDETYDNQLGFERMVSIQKEIYRLCNFSKPEIHKWYMNMTDIYKHNYNRLVEYLETDLENLIRQFGDKIFNE